MSRATFDAKLEAEFASVAANSGCELVRVDVRPGQLRVFLDRPQGVTIDDCQSVSRQLSALLDVADFGAETYTLEVSSPGLDREFYGPRDYERFRGHLVRVTFFTGPEMTKKTVVGRLESFRPSRDDDGEISVAEADTGKTYEIPLGDVKKTRLEIEL